MPAVDTSQPPVWLRASLPVSYVLLVLINTLSSLGYLGPSQADASGKYPTSLVPAGYAFSIWGVIFALQGAGALYAAVPTGYQMPSKCAAVNAVGVGWQLTWLFETAWLLVFPRQTTATFYISALLLFCGLACICWAAVRAYAVVGAPSDAAPNLVAWTLFVLPTSMNAAWMSVASCLGLDVLAASQGMPQQREVLLAALLALIVAGIGAYVVLTRADVAWGLVLVWAFVAVLRAHPHVEAIRTLAVVAIGVAGLCSGYVAVRHWQRRHRRGWGDGGTAQATRGAGGVREALLGGGGEEEDAARHGHGAQQAAADIEP